MIGLVVGFLGILLVLAPWQEACGSIGGELACFGAAISYATSFVYVRKFLSPRGIAPLALAAGQLLVAVLLQALVSPLLQWGDVQLTGRVVASIVLLGVLSTGLAYVLYFRLIADIGATSASAVNYVVPIAAVVVGVLFLGEPVTWNWWPAGWSCWPGWRTRRTGWPAAGGSVTPVTDISPPAEAVAEVVTLASELIRIDTTNTGEPYGTRRGTSGPPPSTSRASREVGYETTYLESARPAAATSSPGCPAPTRAAARCSCTATSTSCPADAAEWTVHPFSGEVPTATCGAAAPST